MTSLHILQFYDLWLSCKRTKLKSEMNKSTLFWRVVCGAL